MDDQNEAQLEDNSILTPETIAIFTEFAVTLKKIHIRLVMKGYTVTEGRIYRPGEPVERKEP